MDKNIVIIGACGVGKSMLSRALMTLQLRNAVITVADISDIKPDEIKVKQGLPEEILLMIHKNEFDGCLPNFNRNRSQYKDIRHGLDRKRNRANRWR